MFGLAFSISFSAVPLLSPPISAAQNRDGSGKDDFQERIYTFKEIHEMADYGEKELRAEAEYLNRFSIRLTWRNHLPPAKPSSLGRTTARGPR